MLRESIKLKRVLCYCLTLYPKERELVIIKKIIINEKKQFENRRQYFSKEKFEIAKLNLRILEKLCLATVMLLIIFLFLTPFIIKGWSPTPQHVVFLPISMLFCIVVFLCKKKVQTSPKIVTALCILFEVILFTFIILIDVFSGKTEPSCFMPMLCVALPAVFIFPLSLSFGMIGFFEIIYAIAIILFKDPAIGQYDVFETIVSLGFSFVVAVIIFHLRIRDYQTRIKFKELSTRDVLLSGIYNKQGCQRQMQKYLDSNNPSVSCSMLFLDLDDFKRINDTLGHQNGDIVLCCIGEILQSTFRTDDIIGRFGGDEFIVFIKGLTNEKVLAKKCLNIGEKFRKKSEERIGVKVSCSIGAVIVDNKETDFDLLFRQADNALYDAKSSGKDKSALRYYNDVKGKILSL